MSDIKAGDLVMVVMPSPCCGNADAIGRVFTINSVIHNAAACKYCGHVEVTTYAELTGCFGVDVSRLKKIDPPSEGDSMPTRREIEVAT